MMKQTDGQKGEWSLPGWPWELELMALVFVIAGLALPLYISSLPAAAGHASGAGNPAAAALREQSGLLWGIGILGMYVIHLLFARSSIDLISTPFTHLFAPLFFAMLAYYRIFITSNNSGMSFPLATGSPAQFLLLALAVMFITLVLARLQMARYMMSLVQTKWEITAPTLMDRSYAQLMAQVKPLFYAPRSYRACEQGIIVEGWFYVMAIPFRFVQSIGAINNFSISTAGNYFATSMHSLIRLELRESTEPLFISPTGRDEFLKYCVQHIARTKHGTGAGTSGGAAANLRRTQRIAMGQTQRLGSSDSQPAASGKS